MEKNGLTQAEVKTRLLKFGPNQLPAQKPPSQFLIILRQFKSPLIYVLLLAAVITIFLGEFRDAAIILFAVFLNTILGFLQESRAQKALTALKNILVPQARVIREGRLLKILARDLVVGDLVVLNTGEKIPADGVLLEAVELAVDESILTGESIPVSKSIHPKENRVYMSTTILTGRGQMEVTATGLATKIGGVAQSLVETEEVETPLQKKIADLAKFLAFLVGSLSFLILTTGLLAGKSFGEMFSTSVALAVAAIPEGLAVSLTVILAVGMQRILKRKALARRLLAAETLGSVTVICTDKTGTLTEGRFKVVSWESDDEFLGVNLAVLCNNLADPEERALWDFVMAKNHFDPEKMREENSRLTEIPFSSKRKFMATINKFVAPNSEIAANFLFVKGAPEVVLEMCKISPSLKKEWEEKSQQWGRRGERVWGMAYKQIQNSPTSHKASKPLATHGKIQNELENLHFLGLVGFSDPPREEAKEVLRIAQEAGIKIKVLTGDFRATAETVLQKIGMDIKPEEILEGEELAHLTFEELKSCVSQIKLFARIDPLEKLRVVQALQENGEVVALVGDGVNDAPALKRAEIGIVVGEATEVAKETADMVLLDSNLKTLVAAIEEGRGIFDNLRKVVTYLMADAFGAVILVTGALVVSFFSGTFFPLPLTAAQILWINLISDGFPNLALTVDPKEKDIMKELPRRPQEAIVDLKTKTIISVVSLFSGVSALLVFIYFFKIQGNLELARSVVFGVLGVNTLFYVFSCRSLRRPLWSLPPFGNIYLIWAVLVGLVFQIAPFYLPILQDFLHLVPLGINEWGIIILISLLVVFWIEILKWIFAQNNKT